MASHKEENALSGEEILVIEDSITQAERLRHILGKHGYRVLVAGNGKTALAMLEEQKPALIISDIIMPGINGYELCRRIKAIDDCRNIPVILLTSLSDPQDVIRGLECGADNFITKPYSEEYLLTRIRYMLVNRYQLPERTSLPGLEIYFSGEKYVITADRRQILDLLLSTYEAAIQKNNELIRARDELNALNEQLAVANRELEAFSYSVSHDLRSPLTNINGFCQVITELCGDKLDEQCMGFVRQIYNQTRRMDQLISTLLNFSRLTKSEIRPETLDLSSMARAIAVALRQNEPERRVTFIIGEGVTAHGDMRLLRVVLENLLGNAWKYTCKREGAEIEFGVTEIGAERTYFVRDNGAGFEMAQADKLFFPFQRLHSAAEFEGHGIGLATVQRIIQRHGGRVWAEGEVGNGASFYFTL
ncbi:MAG: response regulator [Geobacteraceae bacterium]|nr:MAG: response regulator [Geobacteraceae bacterium]